MDRRFAPPGEHVDVPTQSAPRGSAVVSGRAVTEGVVWDGYLEEPDPHRIGIACSGGGIRSASYCLGGLQALREEGFLESADYLSCVSGGGYISIAHAILVSETLKTAATEEPARPPEELEAEYFGKLPPWAPGSPEETHLRDDTNYIAPGFMGKLWLAANFLYGLARHLLPFAAGLYLAAWFTGLALSRWIRPSLVGLPHHVPVGVRSYALLTLVLLGLAAGCLLLRQTEQQRSTPRERLLADLQRWTMLLLIAAAAVAAVLVVTPELLLWLHGRPFHWGWLTSGWKIAIGGTGLGAGAVAAAAASYVARRRGATRLVKVLAPLSAPLITGIPFIGLAYWNARRGWVLLSYRSALAAVSIAVIVVFWQLLDDVTSTPHLYYRERLATVFVGLRRKKSGDGAAWFEWGQPPWKDPIYLSDLQPARTSAAKLPKLVVCAAVNASKDVPPGRAAGSFTFESDFLGGPLTGYIPTATFEDPQTYGYVTLPTMMAISGAAVAPSMGKMTRPAIRFLMALFNLRLGVWLPNPAMLSPLDAEAVRETHAGRSAPQAAVSVPRTYPARNRPGALYVLREALGMNDLRRNFVYVSDGGHFENLGLVELLRRGCGLIVCFDAAGDDLQHFNTLSEAIALARADLGVEIEIKLDELTPEGEFSASDHVRGDITYPDGTPGTLIFAKAAMPADAPQDVKQYRQIDRKFPNHPTLDQFFQERTFESYRALGAHAGHGVVRTLGSEGLWKRRAKGRSS